jgi:thiol-disulfide isomerase/thioredoxin
VGKPAPDFSLTLLDGPGKVKTITKAELAGKVVLIDFWATWCGPCLMELPEIQKLIENYGESRCSSSHSARTTSRTSCRKSASSWRKP